MATNAPPIPRLRAPGNEKSNTLSSSVLCAAAAAATACIMTATSTPVAARRLRANRLSSARIGNLLYTGEEVIGEGLVNLLALALLPVAERWRHRVVRRLNVREGIVVAEHRRLEREPVNLLRAPFMAFENQRQLHIGDELGRHELLRHHEHGKARLLDEVDQATPPLVTGHQPLVG